MASTIHQSRYWWIGAWIDLAESCLHLAPSRSFPESLVTGLHTCICNAITNSPTFTQKTTLTGHHHLWQCMRLVYRTSRIKILMRWNSTRDNFIEWNDCIIQCIGQDLNVFISYRDAAPHLRRKANHKLGA
jgi:hypothetical protein